ncbi:MAG: peptidoglycan DD-metalloendopeptidase family protein [Desulfobacterales bacterium]|nr:peptidoglycan DD-metalloendopeptidase family protein [Desulfobacterales bacterium]
MPQPSFLSAKSAILPKQEQIKEIESKLRLKKKRLKTFHVIERDLLGDLDNLEKDVAEKRHGISGLERKIQPARTETEALKKKLIDQEGLLRDAEAEAAKRLVALYKYARKGYAGVLANASGLNQFWLRAHYVRAIMEEDQKAMVKLAQEGQKYKKRISGIKEQIAKIENTRDKEEERLASLRKDLDMKVIRLAKIQKEKEFYETAVKELQSAARDMKRALSNIEKRTPYNTARSYDLEDYKGHLPFPFKGEVIKSEKILESSRDNIYKGIFIEGLPDTGVKAVFSGRVDFSGTLKGYGDIIIINHGSRFFTISAHLSQRKKEQGDVVEGGEVIGIAGNNEGSSGARLYFEIRRAGRNLDPLEWLGGRTDD